MPHRIGKIELGEQTGYVRSYSLDLHKRPELPNAPPYFTVTITSDKQGTSDATDYFLYRNTESEYIDSWDDKPYAISYGNVQQAMIATLKDALLRRLRVKVKSAEWRNIGDVVVSTAELSYVEIEGV